MQLGRGRQSQSWGRDQELSVLRSAARPNTNVMLRARDAEKLALAKREIEEMLERRSRDPRPLTAKTGVRVP